MKTSNNTKKRNNKITNKLKKEVRPLVTESDECDWWG